ncbi:MAG: thioredoxin family protein [Sedimentisphaerales bacterium]
MNQTWKILIVVVLIVAIIGVISTKRSQSDKEGAGIPSSVPVSQIGDYQIPDEYKVENLTGKGMPVLVDVGAETCIPCKLMAPILEELKEELKGKIVVQFLNLDAYPGLAKEYEIKVKPTQIFYDVSGKEAFRHEGFFSKEDILLKWTELGVKL